MILEYINGGELFLHLRRNRRFRLKILLKPLPALVKNPSHRQNIKIYSSPKGRKYFSNHCRPIHTAWSKGYMYVSSGLCL